MAINAAWRFCSDFACAFFRHWSLLVCFVVVDASIPEALLFDGFDHLFGMSQFLLMFLPRSRVGRIGTQRFDGNEQVRGFTLPDRQMTLVRTELRTGGAMRRVGAAIVHGQMHTIANAIRERRHIQLAHFVLDPPSVRLTLRLGYLNL